MTAFPLFSECFRKSSIRQGMCYSVYCSYNQRAPRTKEDCSLFEEPGWEEEVIIHNTFSVFLHIVYKASVTFFYILLTILQNMQGKQKQFRFLFKIYFQILQSVEQELIKFCLRLYDWFLMLDFDSKWFQMRHSQVGFVSIILNAKQIFVSH